MKDYFAEYGYTSCDKEYSGYKAQPPVPDCPAGL